MLTDLKRYRYIRTLESDLSEHPDGEYVDYSEVAKMFMTLAQGMEMALREKKAMADLLTEYRKTDDLNKILVKQLIENNKILKEQISVLKN